MWYKLLLYIHVLSAIMSIGPFFIFPSVIRRIRTAEIAEQQAYFNTFRTTTRLAKHTGHVLVASGIGLALAGGWPWTTSWMLATIIILIGSLLFLARAFSPKIRRFQEPDRQEHEKALILKKLSRSVWIYLALLLSMLAFMVMKPTLW